MASRLTQRFKASALELYDSPRRWYRRRVLTIFTALFLTGLLFVTAVALAHLWSLSTQRAQEIRQELFQRDLRDLVGRFDADERFVIENNLPDVLKERREFRPLLLPRPYYLSLPTSAAPVLPRQPPRNCFLQLVPKDKARSASDRFCAYFQEDNRAFGRYLYLAATLEDNDVVALKPGDVKFAADAVKLTISANSKSVTWWITFQPPPNAAREDRFQLTAFRQVDKNQRDRDKKLEGWAYVQPQAQGPRLVHVIARLDFKEFVDAQAEPTWPPIDWRDTTISVERRDASSTSALTQQFQFEPTGIAQLSMSALGAQIFSAYGSITLEESVGGQTKTWDVQPPEHLHDKLGPSRLGLKLSGGDLLVPARPTDHAQPLPDTALKVRVSHPWRLVEKGFWQIGLYLAFLLGGGIGATWYFNRNLLEPIRDWSRYSEQLSKVRTDTSIALPHAERRNEVGILATAINALIASVREQTNKAYAERSARHVEAQRKQEEEMQNRVQNLKVMGHEIRSPLQALMALHADASDPSRRYIERMLAALPHLLGGTAASEAIGARDFALQELDIAQFVAEVAQSAPRIDIRDVIYRGPQRGVVCLVDDGAIEDALSNILHNANRHRTPGTAILLQVLVEADCAVIEVWNDGTTISDDVADRIFDFGFSTVKKSEAGGQGVGLYVAKAYIARMGGALAMRNHPAGVVFTIRIPISPSLAE